jgi:hypothetical protein
MQTQNQIAITATSQFGTAMNQSRPRDFLHLGNVWSVMWPSFEVFHSEPSKLEAIVGTAQLSLGMPGNDLRDQQYFW